MDINYNGNRWHIHGEVATNFGNNGPESVELFGNEIQVEVEHNGNFIYCQIPIAVLKELIPKPKPRSSSWSGDTTQALD